MTRKSSLIRRLVRRAGLLSAALMLLVPAQSAFAAPCPNANALPATASDTALQSATLCLLNNTRQQAGRKSLRHNDRLARAARAHARDMAVRNYFSHASPTGSSFVDRIKRTGYLRGGGWAIGENLAWGTGSLATPAAIMRAWMNSPGHRANILNGKFREVGFGGATAPNSGRVMYATEFGVRH